MGILRDILLALLAPFSNRAKGSVGERAVIRALECSPYKAIWNLMLVDENGHSHQIDAVAVGPGGVFAIEVKNYSGKIVGSPSYREWVQYLPGTENRFFSPLLQNGSHCRLLEKKIGRRVYSLVVFAKDNAPTGMYNVIDLSSLRNYLASFRPTELELTDDEIEELIERISSYHHSEITNRDHVKDIRQTGKKLRNGICPRCGTPMVRREGRYGPYWKCPKPECGYHITEAKMKVC